MKYIFLFIFSCCHVIGISQSLRLEEGDSSTVPFSVRDQQMIDSVRRSANQLTGTPRLKMLFDGHFLFKDMKRKNYYMDTFMKDAVLAGDSVYVAWAIFVKGKMIEENGDLSGSAKMFLSVLGIARRHNDTLRMIYALNSLAMNYTDRALYDKALEYNYQSLRVREKLKVAEHIAIPLNNIGVIYDELGDYREALHYYEKSLQIKIDNKLAHNLELTSANIANMLLKLDQVDEAEKKIIKALAICDSLKCTNSGIEAVYKIYGDVLFRQKKYSLAKAAYLKAFEMSAVASGAGGKIVTHIAQDLYLLASVTFEMGDRRKALEYLDQSHEMIELEYYRKQARDNYALYARIYAAAKDYEKAFEFEQKFNRLNTEILNGQMIVRISRLRTELEERENTTRLEAQAKILTLQDESISRQRWLTLSVIAVAVLLAGLTFILLYINRQSKRVNKILDQRVVDRTIELEKQRDELRQAHNEQSALLKKLAADMFSSAASLKGLSAIAKEDLPVEQAAYFKEAEAMAEKLENYVREYPVK